MAPIYLTPMSDMTWTYWHAACKISETRDQIVTLVRLMDNLDSLFKLPDDYATRRTQSLQLLSAVVTAPESLGPMSEEYLLKLFTVGEQILVYLAYEISKHHGGRKIDFKVLRQAQPSKSTTQKEKRHLRRQLLGMCFRDLDQYAPDNVAKRFNEANLILSTASPKALNIRVVGAGVWQMPTLKPLKVKAEEEAWQSEMMYACTKAVQGLGMCLGYRFMRWAVEVQGQVVPGTGVRAGVIKDWLAVEAKHRKESANEREILVGGEVCAPS